jgi:hypothetical protein
VLLLWSMTGASDPLAQCRAVADATARLACYDAIPVAAASAPEPLQAAPPVVAATATAAAAAPAAPSPEEMFGRTSTEVRQATRTELEELTASVTAVQVNYGGKLLVQLDNGQVWSQVDTASLSLRPGSQVRIRRASLGSYMLTEVGHSRSIRVRRNE